jgi:hypothetical protein
MRSYQELERSVSALSDGQGNVRSFTRNHQTGKSKRGIDVRVFFSLVFSVSYARPPRHKQGGEFVVRNFVGVIEDISVKASTVVTDLFPLGALEYYTKKNMGWEYSELERQKWQFDERGGAQGDYREGMQAKIANVIDCLKTEPLSKRAVIPIPFATEPSSTADWKDQGQNKCCRELHLYLEDGKLKCTGIVRMQNATIFVKNIHFFAALLEYVAEELDVPLGEYTHWITNLCHDRSATSC